MKLSEKIFTAAEEEVAIGDDYWTETFLEWSKEAKELEEAKGIQ